MRSWLVAIALAWPTGAAANELDVERVTGALVGSDVELAVHIAVHEPQGNYQIETPPRGVIVAARADGRQLALVAADTAARAMDALHTRAVGGNPERAIAVTHVQPGSALLDIAMPVSVAVDLTIRAPTCFVHDVRYVEIPASWKPAVVGLAVAANPDCPTTGMSTIWLALPTRERAVERIGGRAARLVLGDRHVVKAELALAGRLSEVPADLATAILVDASRSLTAGERDAQRALVAAYLRAAPRGLVQVIAYDRRARPLLASWTVAAEAGTRLDRELRALAPRNGSNVDDGLREAGRWLARTSGTRRVVILGDGLPPGRVLTAGVALRDGLPANTIVHVVNLADAPLERTDTAPLANLARASHGIAMTGGGNVDAVALVRPITLDHVIVKTPGWQPLPIDGNRRCDGTADERGSYPEGTSCTWFGHGGALAGPIVVEGELWTERVVRVLAPDLGSARALARELSVSAYELGKTADEAAYYTRLVDRAAFAVSSVWSLYATWGGRGGYGDLGGFGFGRSGIGPGCCGDGVFRPAPPRVNRPVDPAIRAQLARAIEGCHAGVPVTARVELTRAEIVDVDVDTTVPEPARACVVEAIWSTWIATPDLRDRVTVTVSG